MDYQTALERLLSLTDFERSTNRPTPPGFHIQRMELLLGRLDDPHLKIPTVHVAGTKGKGSTAALIASALTACGYRVGLFTSPHLHTFRERIRIGSDPISEADFGSLVERIWPEVQWVGQEGSYGEVTTFELLTAMAFLQFRQSQADFQVMEVGLGGRLDSTNVVSPEVCVITSISLDHTTVLGDTIERIAREKAGIIKADATVVVAPQPPEALQVFQATSSAKGTGIILVGQDVSWKRGASDLEGQSFQVQGLQGQYDLRIPLLGDHQLENASTALAALEALVKRGFQVSRQGISQGFAGVKWPARLEVLSHNGKTVVVDGAHNPYSMGRLIEALKSNFKYRRVILIFGASGGHNSEGMIADLASLSPVVIAARSRHLRAVSTSVLAEAFARHGVPVAAETQDVGEATNLALGLAQEGDLVLGTGSLFTAAEVIEAIKGIQPELYPTLRRPLDKTSSAV